MSNVDFDTICFDTNTGSDILNLNLNTTQYQYCNFLTYIEPEKR